MRVYFLIITVIICLSGCAPALYVPSGLNIPLASGEGDLKTTVTYGTDGGGFQGSFAKDSHTVYVLNGAYSFPGLGSGRMSNLKMEAGIGKCTYYSEHGRYEFIGGLGFGSAQGWGSTDFFSGTGSEVGNITMAGNFLSTFGQFDIGWTRDNVECGFGVKLSYLHEFGYYNSDQYPEDGFTLLYKYSADLNNFNVLLCQPGFTFSVGSEELKFNFNTGFCLPLIGDNVTVSTLYQPFYATIGLKLNLFLRKADKN